MTAHEIKKIAWSRDNEHIFSDCRFWTQWQHNSSWLTIIIWFVLFIHWFVVGKKIPSRLAKHAINIINIDNWKIIKEGTKKTSWQEDKVNKCH